MEGERKLKKLILAKDIVNISHLEILLSYCFYLCDKDETVILLISFNKKVWNKKIIDIHTFEQYELPNNLEIVSTDLSRHIKQGPLYICNFGLIKLTNWFASKRYSNFKGFIQFDEGSGSWQNVFTLMILGVKEKMRMKKPFVRYVLLMIASWFTNKLLQHKAEKWTWLINSKINKKLVDYLPKVYAAKKQKENIITPNLAETWVMLTSPSVEVGHVTEKEYTNWLKKIFDKIQTDTNYIVLKCHPAEDISKYTSILSEKIIIWKETDSIESLLAEKRFHKIRVLAEYSTSLVTLNILFGIQTYYVKSLVKVRVSGNFKKLLKQHVKPLMV